MKHLYSTVIHEPTDEPKWYQFKLRSELNRSRKNNLHKAMTILCSISQGDNYSIIDYPNLGAGPRVVVLKFDQ